MLDMLIMAWSANSGAYETHLHDGLGMSATLNKSTDAVL